MCIWSFIGDCLMQSIATSRRAAVIFRSGKSTYIGESISSAAANDSKCQPTDISFSDSALIRDEYLNPANENVFPTSPIRAWNETGELEELRSVVCLSL